MNYRTLRRWASMLIVATAVSHLVSPAALGSEPAPGINAFKPRILHTAYFVADIEKSLQFYVGTLGMQERQRFDLGSGVHEVVLQFPDSAGSGVILMWNTARGEAYNKGDGYSRIVLNVNDLNATLAFLKSKNVIVDKGPTAVGSLVYSLIKDPDGYLIELLENRSAAKQ